MGGECNYLLRVNRERRLEFVPDAEWKSQLMLRLVGVGGGRRRWTRPPRRSWRPRSTCACPCTCAVFDSFLDCDHGIWTCCLRLSFEVD